MRFLSLLILQGCLKQAVALETIDEVQVHCDSVIVDDFAVSCTLRMVDYDEGLSFESAMECPLLYSVVAGEIGIFSLHEHGAYYAKFIKSEIKRDIRHSVSGCVLEKH